MDTVEHSVFMECISNTPNGDLTSDATWVCVALTDVLQRASPNGSARTLIAKAADGYYEAYDMADIGKMFVAIGMDGVAIPPEHGHPVRLLYPRHYGMRSVKWLTALELNNNTLESYWADRGWDREAVLRPGSRIDAPDPGDVPATVTVAGVAWGAGPVSQVELSTDGGNTWATTQLEARTDDLAWTRWQTTLQLTPGSHQLVVRATAASVTQDDEPRPPHPSGASGWHRRTVKVSNS
jgi:DMSO/TMAO reductase YedYZ molybdopterin-dependent catalytic subunit